MLYEHALKKNKEKKEKEEERRKKPKKQVAVPNKEPLVLLGFKKEFTEALNCAQVQEQGNKVNYDQLSNSNKLYNIGIILSKLRMIKQDQQAEKEDEETKLVGEIWTTLDGEKTQGIDPDTLLQFCGAILNMQIDLKEEAKEPSKIDLPDKSKEYPQAMTNEEILKIFDKFNLLYLIRKSTKPKKTVKKPEDSFQFKPSLCEESIRLLESKKESAPKKEGETEEENKEDVVASLAERQLLQKKEQKEYYLCILKK